ncbi:MAG: hypothetical protein ACTSWL_08245 [Promethearchaeota archaeon]
MIVESQDNIFSILNEVSHLAKSKLNWHKILFSDWEMPAIQEEYFENLCKHDERFAQVVQRNITDKLIQYISSRVKKCNGDPKHNSNLNIILLGEQDSGKSTYAVKLFLFYRKLHREMWKRDVKHKWTFQTDETLQAYSNVDDFTMILQDEDDSLLGEGARTIEKQLGNLVNRARFTGISLVIACPIMAHINGCDYALQPFGFWKKGAEHYLKTGDPSKTMGRAILYCKSRMKSDGYVPLGFVQMEMGSAIQFMEHNDYYKYKRASFDKIRDGEGASGVDRKRQSKKLEKFAAILCAAAVDHGWDGSSKKELDTWLDFTDIPVLPINEMTKLRNITYRFWQKKMKKTAEGPNGLVKREIDFDAPFAIDVSKILDSLLEMSFPKWKTKLRDIAIYREMALKPQLTNEDFVVHEELKKQFPSNYPKDQTLFTRIRAKVAGYISIIIGEDFELYLKAQYKKNLEIKRVARDGGQSKPDLTLTFKNNKIVYVSAKCFDYKGRSKSIPITKFAPELIATQAALKRKKVAECWAVIYNLFNQKQSIYIFNSEEVANFSRNSKERITVKA